MRYLILIHVMLPLSIGLAIYLFLRQGQIVLFQNEIVYPYIKNFQGIKDLVKLFNGFSIGLADTLGKATFDAIRFNLPDGLWTYALAASMQIQYLDAYKPLAWYIRCWLLVPLAVGIVYELMQLWHSNLGHFDNLDILFITAFYLVNIIIFDKIKKSYFGDSNANKKQ